MGPVLPAVRALPAAEEGCEGGEGHGADHEDARGGQSGHHEERWRAHGGEGGDEEARRGYGEADEAVRTAVEREAGQPQGPAHEEGQAARDAGDRQGVQHGRVGGEGGRGAEGDDVRQRVQVLAELGEPVALLVPVPGDGAVQEVEDGGREDEDRRVSEVARGGEEQGEEARGQVAAGREVGEGPARGQPGFP